MPHYEGGARFGTMIRGGFEPSTVRLEGECSIQLSYRTKSCIRTLLTKWSAPTETSLSYSYFFFNYWPV